VTIGRFIETKFGKDAKLLVSAMVAGIFAGDVDALSLRSCFPDLFKFNAAGAGSLVRGMLLAPKNQVSASTAATSRLVKASGVTFADGMGRLSSALESECNAKGVEVLTNACVKSLSRNGARWSVEIDGRENKTADTIVSTLSPSILKSILSESHPAQGALKSVVERIGNVDVAVVNLCFSTLDVMLPARGFGYLVAEKDEQVEHGVLGVIFDSIAFPEQQPPGYSVVTVMLGGAHAPWVSRLGEQDWIELSRRALSRQLNVGVKPLQAKGVLHRNCIPQYRHGHADAVAEATKELRRDGIIMLGTGVLGAGIADSVGGALNVLDTTEL
jgi:oxygen-dependent protoporphyrinogen oxidase